MTSPNLEAWLKHAIPEHPLTCPWITLAYAQSLDGCLAANRGKPITISGPESMALTHRLRSLHAAILVGVGTILSDNPRLTVRLAAGDQPQPVVLDGHLRTPSDSAIFQHPRQPLIACRLDAPEPAAAALQAAGAHLIRLPLAQDGHLSLPALLQNLTDHDLHSLMVEGGAAVLTAFLKQALADALVLTIAPRLLGGQQAILEPPAQQIQSPRLTHCGSDLIFWGALQ